MLTILSIFLKLVQPKRIKFKSWVDLESTRKSAGNDINKYVDFILLYVFLTLKIPKFVLEKLSWNVVFSLYELSRTVNILQKIPLLVSSSQKEKSLPWDYVGRDWAYYSHLLAKAYGWGLQYIAGMDVDDALQHVQEIMVDDQLDKEFYWGLSEIAYPYNAQTKQSKFSPLPRPYFMWEPIKPIKKVKISKSALPVGIVRDESGMEKYFAEEKNKSS